MVIAYATSIVKNDGRIYFFPDIYGHDKLLDEALRQHTPAYVGSAEHQGHAVDPQPLARLPPQGRPHPRQPRTRLLPAFDLIARWPCSKASHTKRGSVPVFLRPLIGDPPYVYPPCLANQPLSA